MSAKSLPPEINFESIRTCHGTKHGGFEELAVSIFRHEYGEPFEVTRIDGAGGDGGVEAYLEKKNGEIIGLTTSMKTAKLKAASHFEK